MLIHGSFRTGRTLIGRRENGVVMIVALIVLVVMTLAGIGMMRSMDTSTAIAGNMAFKQAATQAADAGVEAAIAWLEQNNAINNLSDAIKDDGYSAATLSNEKYPNDKVFWDQLKAAGVCHLDKNGVGCVQQPEPNVNGNRVSYMIQRLCAVAGQSNAARCAVVAGSVISSGNNEGTGNDNLSSPFANVYYRITVRVEGPRNTVSYVQSIVYL